jgi:chaperonin GroES|tara:strand:- start:646 stop:963 length:318 start_codon:yes stop_codon:yes gene_type:complete
MKLKALFNAVVVKPIESEEETFGNIVVPDLGNEKNQQGEVIAVGPGLTTQMGHFVPTQVKEGDTVVLPTMGFTKLNFEGEEYHIGPENQILAIIAKEEEEKDLPF